MSDRLLELQRQRALLQEHVAWIEREITAEMSRRGAGHPAPAPLAPAEAAPAPWMAPTGQAGSPGAVSRAQAESDAESILEQYREEAKGTPQNVRRGCFLYFAAALVLLGAAVAALYFLTVGRH